ncbi:unnamed protein product [Ceratitis capitata]|uniref:(Mediterranean fruit fly) hypothetical protein n=1 Tax=Ceratitis capitata TaxID=7213 RepID=A0A811V738_CERCA|nr:unnamed protein product [Ceratitis capitata]
MKKKHLQLRELLFAVLVVRSLWYGVTSSELWSFMNDFGIEHTTEIYALYRNGGVKGVQPTESLQLQQQQQLKTGELQLRFRMLFAACTTAAPKPLQHSAHVANNLGQQQLTTLQQLKDQHMMSFSSTSSSSSSSASSATSVSSSAMQTPAQMSPQHQVAATGNAVTAATVAAAVAARASEEAKAPLNE